MNIGDTAEIQCRYTLYIFNDPSFIIDGVTIDSLKTELTEYSHDSLTCPDYSCNTYTLTLSNVSRQYSGTTYQCHAASDDSKKSEIVTLIVRG